MSKPIKIEFQEQIGGAWQKLEHGRLFKQTKRISLRATVTWPPGGGGGGGGGGGPPPDKAVRVFVFYKREGVPQQSQLGNSEFAANVGGDQSLTFDLVPVSGTSQLLKAVAWDKTAAGLADARMHAVHRIRVTGVKPKMKKGKKK